MKIATMLRNIANEANKEDERVKKILEIITEIAQSGGYEMDISKYGFDWIGLKTGETLKKMGFKIRLGIIYW